MAIHPLHALGFEPLLPSLTDLGFEPAMPSAQKNRIPAVRSCSPPATLRSTRHWQPKPCRPIRQGSRKSSATSKGRRWRQAAERKNPSRLAEKIRAEGQPAETVSDYGAAQIAVDSPQAKDAVVAAVKQHFKVLREQDHFAFGDPQYHYRSFRYSYRCRMAPPRSCRSFPARCSRPTVRNTTTTSGRATRSSRAAARNSHSRRPTA